MARPWTPQRINDLVDDTVHLVFIVTTLHIHLSHTLVGKPRELQCNARAGGEARSARTFAAGNLTARVRSTANKETLTSNSNSFNTFLALADRASIPAYSHSPISPNTTDRAIVGVGFDDLLGHEVDDESNNPNPNNPHDSDATHPLLVSLVRLHSLPAHNAKISHHIRKADF